jgi:hypothetical protein
MARMINTKLVGVSHYQKHIIEDVKEGDLLLLEREPENRYDPNAIVVRIDLGNPDECYTVGYINRELAAELAPLMDAHQEIDCEVLNITGGDESGKTTRGVNVKLALLTSEESKARSEWLAKKQNINRAPQIDPSIPVAVLQKGNQHGQPRDFQIILISGILLFFVSLAFQKELGVGIMTVAFIFLGVAFFIRKKKSEFIMTAIESITKKG